MLGSRLFIFILLFLFDNSSLYAKAKKKTAKQCRLLAMESVVEELTEVTAKWKKPIVRKKGMKKIDQIRNNHRIKSNQNIAFAEVLLNGKTKNYTAMSSPASRPGFAKVPNKRNLPDIPKNIRDNKNRLLEFRPYDTEVKILENIITDFSLNGSKPSGIIKIFTERPLCMSCSLVVKRFQKDYPDIELLVSSGPGR